MKSGEKSDTIETRAKGKIKYIKDKETGLFEGSEPSGDNAPRSFVSSATPEEIPGKLIKEPELLSNTDPKTLKSIFEDAGFDVKPLSSGSQKNIAFEDGGGWKVNIGSEGLVMYHPEKGSHHGGAYYKVSTGKEGTKRYDLKGKEKQ